MQGFTFYSPTEVVFGRGAQAGCAGLVRKYGGARVCVVYGEGSVVRSGLLGQVTAQLADAGLAVLECGGVMPNPTVAFARAGVRRAIEFGADFVLAVGGGSAIDAAKAIAHGTANPDIDIWEFWSRAAVLEQSLPVGVVLTISAAGSETSMSAVLTNEELGLKRGLGTDLNRPRFAVMNPEFTFTIPAYPLACGIADIFMHTLDRYFAPETGNETTDAIAAAILRTVAKHAPAVLADPADYHAQSEIMWCGSLSHNTLTGLGRSMDFSVHQLGHELSGKFDVAHGASLTTVWGAWARHVLPTDPARFAQLGREVWDTTDAEEAITATEAFFRAINMPTNFTELGIGIQPAEVLDDLAHRCAFFGTRKVGSFCPIDEADMRKIYAAVNR